MPNKLANRVKMTVSGTPGTGAITLNAALSGFQTFAQGGISNSDTVPYAIEDGASWEIGVGTYSSTGPTLTRTTITASSNSGSAISASSNSVVMLTPLAADLQAGTAAGNLVQLDGSAKLPAVDGSAVTNLNMGAASSGTLPVARGGTGLTSLTAGRIPFGDGTSAFGNSANLFWDSANSRLGVGTSSPNRTLSISASSATIGISATNGGSMSIDAPVSGLAQIDITGANALRFNTNSNERLRIDSSGNVGIGTSSPNGKLDVVCGNTSVFFSSTVNWNFAGLNVTRITSNTASPRLIAMPLDGDSLSSTTIGGYNAIWGVYDSSPTTGSTSSALNGAMVYGAYAGHRWYNNGSERLRIDSSGRVGIGNTTLSGFALRLGTPLTGATNAYCFHNGSQIQSDVTSNVFFMNSQPSTAAASFTLTNLFHFNVVNASLGAGSAITNQYGLAIPDLTSGTATNIGISSAVSSGTGRWNFYANGTAANYFGGVVEMKNVASAPTSIVSGNGVLYVEAGALKYRGSSGTVTTIAAA